MKRPIIRKTFYTDEFCKTHGRVVYTLACRILGDKERARDVVQEVWLRVLKYAGEFHGEAERTTYLYRVTLNECLREEKRNKVTLEELDDETFLSEDDAPHRQLEAKDLTEAFNRGLDQLNPLQKAALTLYIHEGKLYKEISATLGVDEKIVATAISRGRRRIKKALDMEGIKL